MINEAEWIVKAISNHSMQLDYCICHRIKNQQFILITINHLIEAYMRLDRAEKEKLRTKYNVNFFFCQSKREMKKQLHALYIELVARGVAYV